LLGWGGGGGFFHVMNQLRESFGAENAKMSIEKVKDDPLKSAVELEKSKLPQN